MIRFGTRNVAVVACAALLASAGYAAACDAPIAGRPKTQIAGHEPVAWQRSFVLGRTVRLLYFYGGSAPPADIATVSYRRRTVHITLYQKALPTGPPDIPDTLVSVMVCQQIRLTRPLGRRRVVDGLTGRPGPGIPRGKAGADVDLRHMACPRLRVR